MEVPTRRHHARPRWCALLHVGQYGRRLAIGLCTMNERHLYTLCLLASILGSCFAGRPLERRVAVRNAGPLSTVTARQHPGGRNEGPLGFQAPVSRSYLYEELVARGIRPE